MGLTPKQRAAMQQALEALEETTGLCINYESVEEKDGYQFTEAPDVITQGNEAITALREALAEQAEQQGEDVAFKVHRGEVCYKSDEDDQSYGMWCPVTPDYKAPFPEGTTFYATHQKREWVELLDEIDRKALAALCRFDAMAKHSFVKEIRSLIAAFKEANK